MSQRIFQKKIKPLVLITSGTSPLACYLAEILLKKCSVISLDTQSSQRRKIEHLTLNPDFIFLKSNPSNSPEIIKNLFLGEIDYVFHLPAGLTILTSKNFYEILHQTEAILNFARDQNSKILILTTTDLFLFSTVHQRAAGLFELKNHLEKLIPSFLKKNPLNCRLLRTADLYGPKMIFKKFSPFHQILKDAIKGVSLKIPGDGLYEIFPTHLTDIARGATQAMFSPGTSGKTFNLVNPNKTNLLNIAYLIQKILKNQEKRIDLKFISSGEKPPSTTTISHQNSLGWSPKVNLEEGLTETIKSFEQKTRKSSYLKPTLSHFTFQYYPKLFYPPPPKKPLINLPSLRLTLRKPKIKIPKPAINLKISPKFFIALTLLLLFFATIFLPIVQTTYLFSRSLFSLHQLQQNLENLDFQKAENSSQKTLYFISHSRDKLKQLSFLFSLLQLQKKTTQIDALLSSTEKFAHAAQSLSLSLNLVANLNKGILTNQEIDFKKTLADLNTNLDEAYNSLSLFESESETTLLPFSDIKLFNLGSRIKPVLKYSPL